MCSVDEETIVCYSLSTLPAGSNSGLIILECRRTEQPNDNRGLIRSGQFFPGIAVIGATTHAENRCCVAEEMARNRSNVVEIAWLEFIARFWPS
jgi:hypothetical protein